MKDGILYVQHSKFGKVKGGFGAGRGFSLIYHDGGPGAGPSAAHERGAGAALGKPWAQQTYKWGSPCG